MNLRIIIEALLGCLLSKVLWHCRTSCSGGVLLKGSCGDLKEMCYLNLKVQSDLHCEHLNLVNKSSWGVATWDVLWNGLSSSQTYWYVSPTITPNSLRSCVSFMFSGLNTGEISLHQKFLLGVTSHLHSSCLALKNQKGYTLPETNIAPESRPSQKETSIPTIHFQGPC